MAEKTMTAEAVLEEVRSFEKPRNELLDRPLGTLITWNWETIAWVVLLIVAAVARFYEVGARAMSHDESLHTIYSYYLYDKGDYTHNPMMHGPLKFHLNALMYVLFGTSDYSSRVIPAFLGTAMVGAMYFFRNYIGRFGALAAAILITVSPSLLFHSRYIRDDIYIATWAVFWALGAFRYLDTLDKKWLYMMTVAMALGFIGMEAHFITGAIFGSFFVLLLLWQIIGRSMFLAIAPTLILAPIAYYFHDIDMDNVGIPLIAAGLLATVVLAAIFISKQKEGWIQLRVNPVGDVVMVMATLVLPFLTPFLGLALKRVGLLADIDWQNPGSIIGRDKAIIAVLVVLFFAISALIALLWFAKRPQREDEHAERLDFATWGKLMAVLWVIDILFFTTFLTNVVNGLATGIVGSLGYWLAQQQVERGSQPLYYYLLIGGLYEFAPIIFSVCGLAALIRGVITGGSWAPVQTKQLIITEARESASRWHLDTRFYFVIFAIYWGVLAYSGYTMAGERMPWLFTHIALPLCIFGGWWIGRVIAGIDWVESRRTSDILLIAAAPALLVLSVLLVRNFPGFARDVGTLEALTQWLVMLAFWAGLVFLIWRWNGVSNWKSTTSLLGLGVVLLLFVLNTRTSFRLTYINYDYATEYLVYAHGGPDIKRALDEIDKISQRTVGDRNIVVAYDDESSWPLTWYMRNYPNSRFYGASPNDDAMKAAVIIVGPKNRDKVVPYVERDYVKRTYRLVWWPDMAYFGLTWNDVWANITDPVKRERNWQIFFYRRFRDDADPNKFRDLAQWPHRHEFDMYVRRDVAAQVWDLGVTPPEGGSSALAGTGRAIQTTWTDIDLAATGLLNGTYDNLALVQPRAVALGSDGSRLIADSGNHRIVVLDANGSFVRAFGSLCNLQDNNAGCIDPDGDGPLLSGDGQFNQPWGVAADATGNVFVADTWNGRIQVFDQAGKFLRKWGIFNTTNGELGDPNILFGPRGIAITPDGGVLVADTGNKRIIKFTADGQLVNQIGGGGPIPGRFDEPTALAVDPTDGSIFVADAWNKRIQKFGPNLDFQAEWPVPGWQSKEIFHKPYIAVAANGDVYVTDPQMARIFVYNKAGGIKAAFGKPGNGANQFNLPTGLGLDPKTGTLIVADADNNRVMTFPVLP